MSSSEPAMPRASLALRNSSRPRSRYSSASLRSPLRRHTRPILLNATAALVVLADAGERAIEQPDRAVIRELCARRLGRPAIAPRRIARMAGECEVTADF